MPGQVKVPGFEYGFARNGQESFYPSLWRGLVAAYAPEFGVAASVLPDVSGGHNTGTFTGPPVIVPGRVGYAISNTDGQHISVADNTRLQVESRFTVGIWLNSNAFDANFRMAIAKTNLNGASGSTFEIRRRQSNGTIDFVGNGGTAVSTATAIVAGQWYHIVVVFDGTNSIIYMNGEFSATSASLTHTNTSGKPVRIGQRDDLVSAQAWNGKIGAVHIYNRAMRANEVKDLYANSVRMFVRKPSAVSRPASTIRTIVSNAKILKTSSVNILSDAKVVLTNTGTILSNADIKSTTVRTILSGADILNTTVRTILSDAVAVHTFTDTILSDATVLKVQSHTVLADADIAGTTVRTVVSDARILVTTQEQIVSDADVSGTVTRTVLSTATVVTTNAVSVISNAIVFVPLELRADVLFSNDKYKDERVEIEVATVSLGVPTAVSISNTGQGDSLRLEWTGTGPFYNVYRVDPGPVYVKVNGLPISATNYVVGGLTPGISYTFVVRSFDGVN